MDVAVKTKTFRGHVPSGRKFKNLGNSISCIFDEKLYSTFQCCKKYVDHIVLFA